MYFARFIVPALIVIVQPQIVYAGWKDVLKDAEQSIKQEISKADFSEKQIADALKQALDQGIKKSVQQLGAKNGFLHDASVKIPMPKGLKKIEKGLRKIGRDKYADQFISTMNRAAETATSQTVAILLDVVKQMTLKDAINILNGKQDAATEYFRQSSELRLTQLIGPIVHKATDSVGLTGQYKKMIRKSGSLAKYIDKDSLDIDAYITRKTVKGLFLKIAAEEVRIRNNPAARTSNLLKDVFGSLAN